VKLHDTIIVRSSMSNRSADSFFICETRLNKIFLYFESALTVRIETNNLRNENK
jgi:hypothetical protein